MLARYFPRGCAALALVVNGTPYLVDFGAGVVFLTHLHSDHTVGAFPEGHAVNAHEIEPGVICKDANVTVTAFAARHAMKSYGYRFDTKC